MPCIVLHCLEQYVSFVLTDESFDILPLQKPYTLYFTPTNNHGDCYHCGNHTHCILHSQIIMVTATIVETMCGVFHTHRQLHGDIY